jgi:hypothetical protein
MTEWRGCFARMIAGCYDQSVRRALCSLCLGPDHWITCGGGGQCTTCIAFANRFFYPLSEWAIHPPATSPSGLGLDCSSALLALLCCLLQRLRRHKGLAGSDVHTNSPRSGGACWHKGARTTNEFVEVHQQALSHHKRTRVHSDHTPHSRPLTRLYLT